jgi:S-disulfanyl-L-cysteine oxidoreductase SoxD
MRRLLLSIVACIASAAAQAQTPDSTASAGKSVWQGVYNEEQAARGDTEHQNNCTACHGTEKYSGDAFVKAWVGRTAFDLFDQLKTTMPDDNPGGLSAQQYTDIVAYIFKVNGMPAGTDTLSTDPEALRRIKIDAKPDKQSALGRSGRLPVGVDHRSASQLRPMFHPHASIPPTATR